MRGNIFWVGAFLLTLLLMPSAGYAQTDTTAEDSTEVVVQEPLEGIELNVPEEAPGTLGLFWRGLTERVSLLTTFDPAKKAEKYVQFAEERLAIAEKIAAESDDPALAERASAMVERANELIARAQEHQEALLTDGSERALRAVRNILTHEERRDDVLDRIEDALPEERQQQFAAVRERMEERTGQFLERFNEHPNVPEEVKERVEQVKERVLDRQEINNTFRESRREILENGVMDEETRESLGELRNTRREESAELSRQAFEQRKEVLEAQAEQGSEAAATRLEHLEQRAEEVRNAQQEASRLREERMNEQNTTNPVGRGRQAASQR